MGSMIINELKQGLGRKLSRYYIIGIFALCILSNIAVMAFRSIYGSNEGTFAYNIMTYATWCFFIPYYSCIYIADIIFGSRYPYLNNDAIQNNGQGPVKVYLVKLFASILLALVFLAITLVCFIVITLLFHISEKSIRAYDIQDFLQKMTYAVPLWLAGIGMGNMFLFLFEKKRKAYIAYFLLVVVFERGVMFLAAEPLKLEPFRRLRTILITQQFSLIPYPADPARNIPLTVFLGFLYFAVSTIIGIAVYRKKAFS